MVGVQTASAIRSAEAVEKAAVSADKAAGTAERMAKTQARSTAGAPEAVQNLATSLNGLLQAPTQTPVIQQLKWLVAMGSDPLPSSISHTSESQSDGSTHVRGQMPRAAYGHDFVVWVSGCVCTRMLRNQKIGWDTRTREV